MSLEEAIKAAVEEAVSRAVAPLVAELSRLRGDQGPAVVPIPEAARRLGVSVRAVQKWAADGRLEVEQVGGIRMVRLPAGTLQG